MYQPPLQFRTTLSGFAVCSMSFMVPAWGFCDFKGLGKLVRTASADCGDYNTE